MNDSLPLPPNYEEIARTLMASKIYSLAACVMIFYDICITFGDEVEKIWKRRFTGATVLWFMNRYLNPVGYIIVIVSFHQEWPESVCNRYVHYPEILKTITDTAIGLIFILRLYAIYSRSRTILLIFTALLLAEIGIKIWSFTDGIALQLPPGLVGCILTGQSEKRFIWTFVIELIFDSCVFFATLFKALSIYRNLADSSALLIRIVLRDGVMYFATIFAANLITVIFLLAAADDLKPINATFSNMLTSLMVSRLMLNLRVEVEQGEQVLGARTTIVRDASARGIDDKHGFENTVIGNLGGEIHWSDSDHERQDDGPADDEAIELCERYQYP